MESVYSPEIEEVSFSHIVLREGDKDLFHQRLRNMAAMTNEYNGTLPEALESVELLEETGPATLQPGDLGSAALSNIVQAGNCLRNAHVSSVVVEAAHVYMYEDLDDRALRDSVLTQTRHAAVLTAYLRAAGIDVHQVLFVDDYNPDPNDGKLHKRLDLDHFIDLTREAAYRPEMIIREGSMVPLAKCMIDIMRDRQNLVAIKTPDGDPAVQDVAEEAQAHRVVLSRRGIELYRIDEDMVSCAMLDSALSIMKFYKLGEAVMNILPRSQESQGFSYKGQQQKVRHILKEHLNVRIPPFFNLFVGSDVAFGSHNAFRKGNVK